MYGMNNKQLSMFDKKIIFGLSNGSKTFYSQQIFIYFGDTFGPH